MERFVIDLSGWDRVGNKYVYPLTPDKSNWYLHGFVPKNDYTINLYGWYGFTFETDINGVEEITLKVTALEFKEGRDVEVYDTFTWKAAVSGNGRKKVTAMLSQFDLYTCEPSRWMYIRSVEIDREVYNLKAVRAKSVCANAYIMSKPAKTDETVEYDITLANCTDTVQAVSLKQAKKGWETLKTEIENETVILNPYEEKHTKLFVTMNERVTEGGFENQIIQVMVNGSDDYNELKFYTVKYLEYPYLSHREDGWLEVIKKTEEYEWAKNKKEKYVLNADKWEIPEIDAEKPFLYITDNAHWCRNAATAWKLTGKLEYAKKAADFLISVADKKNGYPKTLRACHQQMVHEGEFFKSCAFAYDLIHDCGVLSVENHRDIQETFRMFAWRIDWELSGGVISNWSLAMIAGALYCSMCLQDRALIDRFIYGIGGIIDHMQAGILPDGWWCECTIGYNQMSAGLFSEYAQALKPWGFNLKDMWVPAQYAKTVQPRVQHIDGLSWDIYGGSTKNHRCIKDLWDSLVSMADYRGVVMGVNDCAESKFSGASDVWFDSRYDIAYSHYRDDAYINIIKKGGDEVRDLLFGVGELPDVDSDVYKKSCYFDNGGVSVLRSQTADRPDREQYQGSLKYGSHGGAHGHYDRCAMNALTRFGKSFYNPESIWYTYGTFMYKFYVQNSVTHNMVTTDLKLQEPKEGKNLLFHSGPMMQVNAVENIARWSNPPYGGWRILMGETFKERTWNEGRYVPVPDDAPEYTVRTEFSEPITQRRMMIVTDEYAVNFDYVKGDKEHDFDCIYHIRGIKNIDGVSVRGKTEQLTDSPLSSAQFITDCTWYEAEKDTVKASFEMEFSEQDTKRPLWRSHNRTGYNEEGPLKMDVYYANAADTTLVLGGDPEYEPVNKRLTYRVEADDEVIAEGKFGAWLLGRDYINEAIENKSELKLYTKVNRAFVEVAELYDYVKTIFWGNPKIITKSGESINLCDIDYSCENVDTGNGVGVDYFGGRVKIQAMEFDKAIPGEPTSEGIEAVITVNLEGLDAMRFEAYIGASYPLGERPDQRMLIANRKTASEASFISVIELYEAENKVKSVEGISDTSVRVTLTDGTYQEIEISNLDTGDNITAHIREYKNGVLLREEATGKE